MKKKKVLLYSIAIVAVLCIIYFAPPIMIAKGAIIIGTPTDNFDSPWAHLEEEDKTFEHRDIHYTTDFKHFYFINLRFWETLNIQQIEYSDPLEDPNVKKILPLLYSADQNLKTSYQNTFGVKRGNKYWYFDYYANLA